jgi:hypothetical protein
VDEIVESVQRDGRLDELVECPVLIGLAREIELVLLIAVLCIVGGVG